MTPAQIKKAIKWGVLVIVILILAAKSFGTVGVGEVGIKTRLSKIVGTVETGPYFKIPFIEKVKNINVQTQSVIYDSAATEEENPSGGSLLAASKDLQDVSIAITVNYHIDPSKIVSIYRQYGSPSVYKSSVVEPIIRDAAKSMSSLYTAEELVTKRLEYNEKVTHLLNDILSQKYLVLEKVNVTNFEFSKAFTDSIEAKVTAIQNAEAAKNKLVQVQFEAQQKIETAKADAETIKIQAQAITSQGGADYVKLQWIKAWSAGGAQVPKFITGNGGQNFLLDIND